MPRKINPEERQAQSDAIKQTARDLMHEHGTAGLSLRAIARQLGMTAPALYYYYDNLDALITSLIVDGFNGIAQAMEEARDTQQDTHPAHQLLAILIAYRNWALTHPADFQLLYGNPIPGYHAPRDVTVPAVMRGFVCIITTIQAVLDTGQVTIPDYLRDLPPVVYETYQGVMYNVNETTAHQRELIAQVSVDAMNLGIYGWGQMHGLIMLELFGHLQPVIGDADVYYQHQLWNMFRTMGLHPDLIATLIG